VRFRHLEYPPGTGVEGLGPAGIDDLLDRGDLESWTPLLRAIARDPWSATADTVLRLCEAHPMYGTSMLWRTWIERRRQRSSAESTAAPMVTTLADARARAGLTQSQVASRMGISQADVSKLERRADVRLSTLRAYAEAIGAELQVGLREAGGETSRPLVLAARHRV
jgi:DNA-binding XRE family transcriptional regulator